MCAIAHGLACNAMRACAMCARMARRCDQGFAPGGPWGLATHGTWHVVYVVQSLRSEWRAGRAPGAPGDHHECTSVYDQQCTSSAAPDSSPHPRPPPPAANSPVTTPPPRSAPVCPPISTFFAMSDVDSQSIFGETLGRAATVAEAAALCLANSACKFVNSLGFYRKVSIFPSPGPIINSVPGQGLCLYTKSRGRCGATYCWTDAGMQGARPQALINARSALTPPCSTLVGVTFTCTRPHASMYYYYLSHRYKPSSNPAVRDSPPLL